MPYENYRNIITMPDYHRTRHPGSIFLPAATSGDDLLTRRLDSLRQGCGWYGNIILSSSTLGSVAEHLHCVIELPRGDANFPTKCLVPQYAEMEYCQLRREELWDNYCMGVP